MQEGKCVYTHIPLTLHKHGLNLPDIRYSASLDRIDSTKGYIKDNVQFISTAINLMKNTLTTEQTKEFLQIIIQNADIQ